MSLGSWERHEEASAPTARVLPTTELASVEVCSRPDSAASLDASPPRGLPAWSGDPSPGKKTSPHGDKLRGGGPRDAGGVLVMNIARPGQAQPWRTCRREKTAERRDLRIRSDRRRDRASASHQHRDSPTATKTNRSPTIQGDCHTSSLFIPCTPRRGKKEFVRNWRMGVACSLHACLYSPIS